MQLYGALSARLFGNKRARTDLAPANALTVQEFFTVHNNLAPFLYDQVRSEERGGRSEEGRREGRRTGKEEGKDQYEWRNWRNEDGCELRRVG